MPAPADLVHQASISTGTGNITLTTLNGRQTFGQAFGIGGFDTFRYYLSSKNNPEWETGTGHLVNATTLIRDTVIKSSNADALVNFSAGTMDVTNDVGADNVARIDGFQIFTGKITFEDKESIVGDVATPTDALADQGGLILKGTTDKTILWDQAADTWKVAPAIQAPRIDATSEFFGPDNGTWDADGIKLNSGSNLSIDGQDVLVDNGGSINLRNILALDAATENTIEASIDTLNNVSNIGATSDFITTPIGDLDGALGMSLSAGLFYRIGGASIIGGPGGAIQLANIDIIDPSVINVIENDIVDLPILDKIQTLKVKFRDAGTNVFFGWHEPSNGYDNLTSAEATAILNVASPSLNGLSSAADKTKLDTVATGAEVNPDVVPQAEAEAGTATTERIWTAQRVNQSIQALSPGGGASPTFVGPIDLTAGSPSLVILASGIAAGAREIVIAFESISHNFNNQGWIIQIGDSGGLETSGYIGGGWQDVDFANNSNGYRFTDNNSVDAVTVINAVMTLQHMGNNQWSFSALAEDFDFLAGVGTKTLSGELTQIALTTFGGSATIDSGTARIRYL